MKAFGTKTKIHSSTGAALIWTAVVYQLTTSSNAQNNGPGYLGCFEDGWAGGRSLRGDSTTSGSLFVEWCFNYCTIKGYKYAGVESETECYCGNNEDYDSRGKAADSECRNTCPGNSNQFCGGSWRLAIYQISQGICNNAIGPPVHGSHEVTNPTHVSFSLQNSKFFGTRVRFECDTGYVIEGAEAIECIQRENDAEWSHPVPTCTLVPLTTFSYTVPSLLPTSMNQTTKSMEMTTISYTVPSTASVATNSTKATTSSAVPPSSTDATDWQDMSNQTSQTGTIIGIAAGVIASLMILLVIVTIIFKKRQKRREGIIDGANGTVNTQRADVTQGAANEIPSRPGAVNPNPPDYDVITNPTYEIPNLSGAVNRNPKKI